ncbi:hypothetical protein ACX1N5_08470 [Acinetobacter sp. ANC 4636]|uniref:hypothetical protein n=1 Tax=Acinetobacter sp. ANC 4635 TaxID=2529846 RepID=UPI00103C6467|nr:hypothetical protein [Acinetobacter sp. ANC 4635]TCB31622.1 hypothetical protein E0H86_08085 [Acinetobacter sp. ANC 4635]
MKSVFILCLACSVMSTTYAASCSVGNVTEPKMMLASYYHSQSATSFSVNCDRGYSILFSSMNLRSADGTSYVSNGAYKLRTKLTISGPVENLWNVPLTANTTGTNRYIIAVHLEEQPSIRTPAGVYRDMIYVNLSF